MTALDPDDLVDDLASDEDVDSDTDTDDDEDFLADLEDELDEDLDDLEDADDEEIDFCVALYREDGEPVGVALEPELANDFEDLIAHLQRIPGDAGAIGLVSLDSEVLVALRVRGPRHVQVLVSDAFHANTWPLVRDAVDFLGLDPSEIPEEGPLGDLGMFADQGMSEMDMDAMFIEDDELTSEDIAERLADAARFGTVFRKAVDDYWEIDDED